MSPIDWLLLLAIILVILILGAGSYILMFERRFNFLQRPYPQAGTRLSRRLLTPPAAPSADANGMEIARELSAAAPQGLEGVADPAGGPPGGVDADARSKSPNAAKMEIACEPAGMQDSGMGKGPVLPCSYGDCRIIALVRDPHWLFVYWDINEERRGEIAGRYGCQAWENSLPVLRVYDVTNLYYFDSRHYREIFINDYADNWYLRTGQPNRTFCIELGRVSPDGSFIFVARSNYVSTPRDQRSDLIDEEWLLPPEYSASLQQRIGGSTPGPSSPGLNAPGANVSSPMRW